MAAKLHGLREIREWIEIVKDKNSTLYNRLNDIYGDDDSAKTKASEMCLQALETFAQRYGADRSVIITVMLGEALGLLMVERLLTKQFIILIYYVG